MIMHLVTSIRLVLNGYHGSIIYIHVSSSSQNLGEAEYAVALFMYMRLQGYPPDKIAILTTYNGQKHLIRDVLNKRCARNPVFGLPEKVCL